MARAFEAEEFDSALEQADALLTEAPGLPEALHYSGRGAGGAGAPRRSSAGLSPRLKASPEDLEILLGAADFLVCRMGEDREAVEEGLALCERGRRQAEREDDVELVYEFLLLEGDGAEPAGRV